MRVSVIVPVYNVECYLRRCLDSCVNQTLKDIEIIVINDGSTDNSLEIAEEYAKKYDNIILKSIHNSGLSVARNTGLAMAKGKYVYFVDSDDWMEENCLEELFNLAEKNILEVITFDAKKAWEEGCSEDEEHLERHAIIDGTRIYTGTEFVREYKDREGILVQAWTYFVRRDFLNKNGIIFLPNAIYEDMKYHMDLLIACNRMMYLPMKLYNRFYRRGSIIISNVSERKLLSMYEITLGVLGTLEESVLTQAEKTFWLSYYIEHEMNIFFGVFCHNVSYKEIQTLIKSCYEKVEEMQFLCISKCYEILTNMQMSMYTARLFLHFVEEILRGVGVISSRQYEYLVKLELYCEKYIEERIKKLPLSEKGRRYGIYGSGNHTRFILDFYRRKIGTVESELICIDSYKETYTEQFEGMDIINITDIDLVQLDGIIISSFLYEEEMMKLAQVATGYLLPIYRLYEQEKCSLDAVYDGECIGLKKSIMRYKDNFLKKRIFLLETPYHTNVGDYLITYAEECFLKKYFSEYDVIEVNANAFINNIDRIWSTISITDVILINGGGFFGSQWVEGEGLRKSLQMFQGNKTVILPQSLYYEENKIGQKKAGEICEIVRTHKALQICYRESISWQRGQMMFGTSVNQHLIPDMALFLNELEGNENRKGIVTCLRKDKEGVLSQEERGQILEMLKGFDENIYETSMHWNREIMPDEAKAVIAAKLDEFRRARLVITDTLHCMISCVLVGTPCIALPNITGKVEGVYKWIEELEYIRFISSISDIANALNDLLSMADGQRYKYDLRFAEYERQLYHIIESN